MNDAGNIKTNESNCSSNKAVMWEDLQSMLRTIASPVAATSDCSDEDAGVQQPTTFSLVVDNARGHRHSVCPRRPFQSHSDSDLYCSDSALYFRPEWAAASCEAAAAGGGSFAGDLRSPQPRNKRKLSLGGGRRRRSDHHQNGRGGGIILPPSSSPHLYGHFLQGPPMSCCDSPPGRSGSPRTVVAESRWDSIISPKKHGGSPTGGAGGSPIASFGGLHDIARTAAAASRTRFASSPNSSSAAAAASRAKRMDSGNSADAAPLKPSRPSAPPLSEEERHQDLHHRTEHSSCSNSSDNDSGCFAPSKLSLSMPRRPRRRVSWDTDLSAHQGEFEGATTAEMISKVLEELNIADDEGDSDDDTEEHDDDDTEQFEEEEEEEEEESFVSYNSSSVEVSCH